MKSQSDINSSSFEEVETHGPCCQLGRSGGVTAAGKQEFSPSTFPPTSSSATLIFPPTSSATLIPHIYFKLSTYFPLNTFPPTHFSVLYFYLKLFPQISVEARSRTVNLIRGAICFGGNISPCFFTPAKYNTQNRTKISNADHNS